MTRDLTPLVSVDHAEDCECGDCAGWLDAWREWAAEVSDLPVRRGPA